MFGKGGVVGNGGLQRGDGCIDLFVELFLLLSCWDIELMCHVLHDAVDSVRRMSTL